ncbi:MAG TPA: helicase C-terminal domain-containing protein, partial [Candidatus Omnitrophota bacterium]|nr:helicase C-terminal domain-containing protein [Candidatus Omnitrophota bacterium]
AGKSLIGLAIAVMADVNLLMLPNQSLLSQLLANDREFFLKLAGGTRVIVDGNALAREATDAFNRGERNSALMRVQELTNALNNKKGALVVMDRESAAQLQNTLRKGEPAAYSKYLEAYENSNRLFDEVHQCANPMYFIVGGDRTPASLLSNYKVLDTVAQEAGKIVVFTEAEYRAGIDKDGSATKVLVTTDAKAFEQYKKDGIAAVYKENGKVTFWTGEKIVKDVFMRNKAISESVMELKRAKGDNVTALWGSELFSILKSRAIDFRDGNAIITELLSNNGVALVDGQYRPVSAVGEKEVNQIIEDTAWLIGIAHTVKDAYGHEAKKLETRDRSYDAIIAQNLRENMLLDTRSIELTSTVTAVSMFDLFVTRGTAETRGMSGTLMGVAIPIEVMTGRSARAVARNGETGSFTAELFMNMRNDAANRFEINKGFGSENSTKKGSEGYFNFVEKEINGLLKDSHRATIVGLETNYEIARLAEKLKADGRDVLVIDGSLTQAQVEGKVKEFNDLVRANTQAGGNLSREIVILTNQRGLTGLDYQGRLNFMLFDPSLPEALLRQSGGRVGRTIKDTVLAERYGLKVGETYESLFKLYLDRDYVAAQRSQLEGP